MTAPRPWAYPLVPLYAAGLAAKDGLRAIGALPTRKLARPVVSVGSLSAGGAGKTPVVIALAELLRERGWHVDVLSRGYGRTGSGVERVDAEVANAAERFGDEPLLIARRTGVPVWVGTERFAAGQAAESASAGRAREYPIDRNLDPQPTTNNQQQTTQIHLLDDGFQHRQLARNLDIVLLTQKDLCDALLPAGNRREPLSALRRADVVVLRADESARIEAQVRNLVRDGAALWTVQRSLQLPEAAAGRTLVAFSGIARPQNFLDTLRTEGARVVDSVAFADHHRYTAEDMGRVAECLRAKAAEAFITTEKDAVKLTPALRAQLEATAPVLVAGLRAVFLDPQTIMRDLEARIG